MGKSGFLSTHKAIESLFFTGNLSQLKKRPKGQVFKGLFAKKEAEKAGGIGPPAF
jgi:hypothetical protein